MKQPDIASAQIRVRPATKRKIAALMKKYKLRIEADVIEMLLRK